MQFVYFNVQTDNNQVRCEWPAGPAVVQQFPRRWEALLFGLLLQASQRNLALSAESVQVALQQRGQAAPLNRAQLQRLLNNLQRYLSDLPGLQARIESPPRKHTVGPWTLRSNAPLGFEVDGQVAAQAWPYPGLTPSDDLDLLHRALSLLLVADALAAAGAFADAIDALQPALALELCAEARGLVLLRLCGWFKATGRFEAARSCARLASARPTPADPGLAGFAAFSLQRIDYDQNPDLHWQRLWRDTSLPPHSLGPGGQLAGSRQASDWRSMADWSNLRALLARRRMQAAADAGAHADTPALHRLALRHLQAALYTAAWQRDWDRLQAYVANHAYHLQVALGQGTDLGVRARQVMDAHRLVMAYEDKLGAGRDSAWEYIFFGRFWLDHHDNFEPVRADPIAHTLGGHSPEHESFYERGVQRLRECADPRQVAMGLTLQLRFAQNHLSSGERPGAVRRVEEDLRQLLASHGDTEMGDALRREGYTEHWPEHLVGLVQRRPSTGSRTQRERYK